jgi:hypothetical protein
MATSPNSARKLTKAQLKQVQDAIAGGEFQEAIHQQVAPLLKHEAGSIVLRGTAQNATAVIISPYTGCRWVAGKALTGARALRTRVAGARAARLAARADKAELVVPEVVPA